MIRELTPIDVPQVLDLSKEFSELDPISKKYFSEEKTKTFLYSTLINPDRIKVFVAEVKDTIVGFFVILKNESMFLDLTVAGELLWYVKPEFRNRDNVIGLWSYAYNWANEIKADYIMLSEVHSIQSQKKLYGKLGLEPRETTYVRPLQFDGNCT